VVNVRTVYIPIYNCNFLNIVISTISSNIRHKMALHGWPAVQQIDNETTATLISVH